MSTIAGFPYFEIQFTKEGKVFLASEAKELTDYLQQNQPTDLFVISHGWLTDTQGAKHLYETFFDQIRNIMNGGRVSGIQQRSFVVLGVLWPSKKFASQELTAGGAASAGDSTQEALEEQLAGLEELIGDPGTGPAFQELRALIPQLPENPVAGREFADLVRRLLPRQAADDEDASSAFFDLDSEEIVELLGQPILADLEVGDGGGAADMGDGPDQPGGDAAGFPTLGGITGAAANLLNFATYYEMKQRAGMVGMKGLNPLLQTIHQQHPALQLHLVGHSFGGRLVSAAALGNSAQPILKVDTLSLLQSAFSHYGFAKKFDGSKDGFFRKVVDNHCVAGATLITHTSNDRAVGVAYPIASALARDNASALGDENDRFGAIGRNGAQKTPEAVAGLSLLAVGQPYGFQAGKLHNLKADAYIKNHGDICGPEVAYAVLTAVAMS